MTISAYQVDNVIKACSKQNRARLRGEDPSLGPVQSRPSDQVTLSGKSETDNINKKISYTILDLLKK